VFLGLSLVADFRYRSNVDEYVIIESLNLGN
jgi:hypothetical protein